MNLKLESCGLIFLAVLLGFPVCRTSCTVSLLQYVSLARVLPGWPIHEACSRAAGVLLPEVVTRLVAVPSPDCVPEKFHSVTTNLLAINDKDKTEKRRYEK